MELKIDDFMNKERKARLEDVTAQLEEAKKELEDIINDEQDAYDSLPEGFQSGTRGDKMLEYIGLMEDAVDKIESAIGFIEVRIINNK